MAMTYLIFFCVKNRRLESYIAASGVKEDFCHLYLEDVLEFQSPATI